MYTRDVYDNVSDANNEKKKKLWYARSQVARRHLYDSPCLVIRWLKRIDKREASESCVLRATSNAACKVRKASNGR